MHRKFVMVSFKRILVSLSALLLGGLGFASAAPAAHAEDSVSWTVRTALSQYGSDRSMFTYTMKSGEQLTDGLDIANRGSQKITLKIYAADGFTTDTGGFDILTPDKKSKDIGSWVKTATSSITIPAGKEVQVPFNVTVPDNATPGDHMGGIVTVLDEQGATSGGTVIHQRVGLRIKVRVSGEVTPQLKVENLKLHFDGTNSPFGTGKATLTYTVHNTGNAVLGGLQKIKVSGGFGASARTVDAPRLPNLLPGETWDASVPVDKVHAMVWVAGTVTVTPVVTDAAGSTSTLKPIEATAHATASVWSLVFLILFFVVLIAVGVLAFFAVKRLRKASKLRVEAKVAAAVEDALKDKVAKT